jgi:hypothetical protein
MKVTTTTLNAITGLNTQSMLRHLGMLNNEFESN